MNEIYVLLNKDRNILEVSTFYQSGNWIKVEYNSEFSIDEMYKWTVRESDNALVHISSNQTPEEEKNTVITKLMLQNLTQSNEIDELKKISTAQALQALQDSKDKEEQQKVITNLTVQILKLQQTSSSTDDVEK